MPKMNASAVKQAIASEQNDREDKPELCDRFVAPNGFYA